MKKDRVYMMVTMDKYELPILVAESVRELAERSGTSENVIRSQISKHKHGIIKRSKFICVEIGGMT